MLYNYFGSSYQGWDSGSALIFWRWPDHVLARDGIPPYIFNTLPTSQRRAYAPSLKVQKSSLTVDEVKQKIADKFVDYIKRGYIKIVPSTKIKNFIDYFAVPKPLLDIRAVFNGTSCGLNEATWASHFCI